MINPYERLANGIIEQAVKDYRQAVSFLKKHPRTKELEDTVAAQLDEKKKRCQTCGKPGILPKRVKRSREESLLEKIRSNEQMTAEIEKFFLSDWFMDLTEIDGKWLLGRLKREMEAD